MIVLPRELGDDAEEEEKDKASSLRLYLQYVYTGQVSIDVANVCGVYQAAFVFEHESLAEACAQFIDEHTGELLSSGAGGGGGLRRLSAQSLASLLARDTFCESELSIFQLLDTWHGWQRNNLSAYDSATLATLLRLDALSVYDLERLRAKSRSSPLLAAVVVGVNASLATADTHRQQHHRVLLANHTHTLSRYRAIRMPRSSLRSVTFKIANPTSFNRIRVHFNRAKFKYMRPKHL